MLLFPNLPITSPDNEQHNLKNKDLENDKLEGQPQFSFSKHCFTNLYNVVDSNGFNVSTSALHM
jgi:hypothetical protein